MFFLILNTAGALAIFIFGMKIMSEGLHRSAGDRMRDLLHLFSANRVVAVIAGCAVTAVIQSSSATTVMVVGFVNSGLLNLLQSIGIIFGANIGTTVTAQLVAFDIGWIVMPAIILGLLLGFIPRDVWKGWGDAILGLGFLFLGMRLMSDELQALSHKPEFLNLFAIFDCAPINGSVPFGALLGALGIGLAATLLIQSSSACTGIIIALGAGGIINIYTATALVLGSNIGTTITAQLAAIPANRIAKQAALAHTLFNVFGVLLALPFFYLFTSEEHVPGFFRLINSVSGSTDLARHIANAHTVFNVCTTLVLLPFVPFLAKLCSRLIPAKPEKVEYNPLDRNLLDVPAVALRQSATLLQTMLKRSTRMFFSVLSNREKISEIDTEKLDRREERVDAMQQDITDYLTQLMSRKLEVWQTAEIPLILHCVNDAERIGDHAGTLLGIFRQFDPGKNTLSKPAQAEIAELEKLLGEQADYAASLLESFSLEKFKGAALCKNRFEMLCSEYENEHLKRLRHGKCRPISGVFYIELIDELRKISRHLGNIQDRAQEIGNLLTSR